MTAKPVLDVAKRPPSVLAQSSLQVRAPRVAVELPDFDFIEVIDSMTEELQHDMPGKLSQHLRLLQWRAIEGDK